jgi:acetyltransferase AlgX (SGNH hydrolase-like protein)
MVGRATVRTAAAAAALLLAFGVGSYGAPGDRLEDFLQRTRVLLARPTAGHPWPVPGLDGWLFFRGDLEVAGMAESSTGVALERISFAAEQLRSVGIHLLVVPIPCKWAIYPDRLFKDYTLPAQRLDPWLGKSVILLRQRSVDVLDLTGAMLRARRRGTSDLWIPPDSHNSPAGYELIADAVVEHLRPRLKSKGVAMTGRAKLVRGTLRWYGDLNDYADRNESFDKKLTDPAKWRDIGGNFVSDFKPADDAQIVFVGDSNNSPRNRGPVGAWGVGPFVGAKLGAPVAHFVSSASAGLSMKDLFVNLRRGTRDSRRPKIVVWIFASRSLMLSDWQFPPLPRIDGKP